MDISGRMVLRPIWDHISPFIEGVAVVQSKEGRRTAHGLIDLQGTVRLPAVWESIDLPSEGRLRVVCSWGGPKGFVDLQGHVIVPLVWCEVRAFSQGRAAVQDANTGLWGFVDHSGATVIPPSWEEVRAFVDGRAAAARRVGGVLKWGFIDQDGKESSPFAWDAVDDFSEGLAAVRLGTERAARWGYVNPDGRIVIPLQPWLHAGPFTEGSAVVRRWSKRAWLGTRWREIRHAWRRQKEHIQPTMETGQPDDWRYDPDLQEWVIDRTGNWVVEPMAWQIRRQNGGFFAFCIRIPPAASPLDDRWVWSKPVEWSSGKRPPGGLDPFSGTGFGSNVMDAGVWWISRAGNLPLRVGKSWFRRHAGTLHSWWWVKNSRGAGGASEWWIRTAGW